MISQARQKKVSIKVIADELGVSVSSVSRALNNHRDSSAIMKERVLDCAKRRGYRPNILAQTLCKGSSDTIGIIVPNFSPSSFSLIVDAMVDAIEQRGYIPMLCTSRDLLINEVQYVNNLTAMNVCGALVALSQQTQTYDHFDTFNNVGVPVCYYGRIPTSMNDIDAVIRNDQQAFSFLTKELIRKGSRRIAFVSGPDYLSTVQDSFRGFIEVMNDYGLEINPDYIINTDINSPDRKAIERLICGCDGLEAVDGVVCMADSLIDATIRVINGVNKENRCMVAGYTQNRIYSLFPQKRLCILEPNYRQMGTSAANKLIDAIENKCTLRKVDIVQNI